MKPMNMHALIALATGALLAFSCGNQETDKSGTTPIQSGNAAVAPKQRIPIDTSGYSIELEDGLLINDESQPGFNVYYFTPQDTTKIKGEAGIYFGPNPDMSAPSKEHTKRTFIDMFMDKPAEWTEYSTSTYTQRETFLQEDNGNKIHCWCYSNNSQTLEMLFKMIKTIRRDQ
ncbi:MAG: hypothetical protein Fur0041_08280 [Bacteroidia bacterium]